MLFLDNICVLCLVKVGWVNPIDMHLEDDTTAKDRLMSFSCIHTALNCFSGLSLTWG